MKITVKKDGSLLVDGMNRTALYLDNKIVNNPSGLVEGLTEEQIENSVFTNFLIFPDKKLPTEQYTLEA